MEQTRLNDLFDLYINGQISPEQEAEFFSQLAVQDNLHELEKLLEDTWAVFEPKVKPFDQHAKTRMLRAIYQSEETTSKSTPKKIRLWYTRTVIAAAVLALAIFGTALFYWNTKPKGNPTQNPISIANDIPPGKAGATLTLFNGQKIKLSDVSSKDLAKQTGLEVSKTENGQLVYTVYPPLSALGMTEGFHTLSTSRGEQYSVVLPDGSQVWLNAESSIKYPTSFARQGSRRVSLTGEGYFEISKDTAHPFIVETDKQKVEVLGTHFNINSYTDEPSIKTTLIEGSVRVSASAQTVILRPNQQSILTGINPIRVEAIDPEETMAWKNGYFRFKDEKIQSIMRKISRWYNIDIEYIGEMPSEGIAGRVSRSKNISQVLQALEATKLVHFTIEGRKVLVRK